MAFDLIQPNATVAVYQLRTSRGPSGGNSQALSAALAAGVPVSLALATGGRDGRFAGDVNLDGCTIDGDSPFLGRQDTVVRVESVNPSLPPSLLGLYGRVTDVADHAAGDLIDVQYTAKLSFWEPCTS